MSGVTWGEEEYGSPGGQQQEVKVGSVEGVENEEGTGKVAMAAVEAPVAAARCTPAPCNDDDDVSVDMMDHRMFPEELFDMLNEEAKRVTSNAAISWLSNGCGFIIRHPYLLTQDVLPRYFKHCKFDSFTRKLYRWGFRKNDVPATGSQADGDCGTDMEGGFGPVNMTVVFYHKYFCRSNRDLCRKMRSVVAPRKKKRKILEPPQPGSPQQSRRGPDNQLGESSPCRSSQQIPEKQPQEMQSVFTQPQFQRPVAQSPSITSSAGVGYNQNQQGVPTTVGQGIPSTVGVGTDQAQQPSITTQALNGKGQFMPIPTPGATNLLQAMAGFPFGSFGAQTYHSQPPLAPASSAQEEDGSRQLLQRAAVVMRALQGGMLTPNTNATAAGFQSQVPLRPPEPPPVATVPQESPLAPTQSMLNEAILNAVRMQMQQNSAQMAAQAALRGLAQAVGQTMSQQQQQQMQQQQLNQQLLPQQQQANAQQTTATALGLLKALYPHLFR